MKSALDDAEWSQILVYRRRSLLLQQEANPTTPNDSTPSWHFGANFRNAQAEEPLRRGSSEEVHELG